MLNLLKVDLMASIDADALFGYVISKMEIKLSEAKKSTKNGNFSEQEQIIQKLKEVRRLFYIIEQNNLTLVKECQKQLKDNKDVERRLQAIIQERAKLEKELETIKDNISAFGS